MNRNFPPPPQPFRRPRPDMNAYMPARVLMALIGQSEKRYMFLREAAMKMDAGFGELEMVFEGEPLDPTVREWLDNLAALGDLGKQDLEYKMKYELHLQGELKRFLMGRPPSALVRRPPVPPQLVQNGPPPQQMPQQMGPQQMPQQQMPPQQTAQQGFPQMQMPEIPPGGQYDLRDPKQAAAALLRAQSMPLGPGSTQPQQGAAFVPPGAYGVPQAQAAYGVSPGAYVPPQSQVPVMQGVPETATQVMQQSLPQQPVVSVPAPQPNGVTKNATS